MNYTRRSVVARSVIVRYLITRLTKLLYATRIALRNTLRESQTRNVPSSCGKRLEQAGLSGLKRTHKLSSDSRQQ